MNMPLFEARMSSNLVISILQWKRYCCKLVILNMQTDVFLDLFIRYSVTFLNYSKNTYNQIAFLKILSAAMITNAFDGLHGAVNNPQMILDGLVFLCVHVNCEMENKGFWS